MKRILQIILVSLMLICLLAGCEEPAPESVPSSSMPPVSSSSKPTEVNSQPSSSVPASSVPGHVCQSGGQWQFDLRYHWRLCDEHGEKTDVAEHSINFGYCSTCKVFFSDLDGWTLLHNYNEYRHLVLGLSYDENGVLMYKDFYEYTYNEEGTMLSQIYYENDILVSGFHYNDYAHQTAEIYYKPDGSIEKDIRNEYTYDEQGRVTGQKHSVNDAPDWESYYAYVGETRIITLQVNYDEKGNKTAVHHSYDDNANPTESTTYVNDVLTTKYEYTCIAHPVHGIQIQTARKYLYNPDGSYTLYDYTVSSGGEYAVSVYDADGRLLSTQYYDADDNPIEKPGRELS